MVRDFYVRQSGGNDEAVGTDYFQAYQTVAKCLKHINENEISGDPIVIHVFPGYYLSSILKLVTSDDLDSPISVIGYGNVIIKPTAQLSWMDGVYLSGINFENWTGSLLLNSSNSIYFNQCSFKLSEDYYQQHDLSSREPADAAAVRMSQCTLYGINSVNPGSVAIDVDRKSIISKSIIANCVSLEAGTIVKGSGGDIIDVYSQEDCFDIAGLNEKPPFVSDTPVESPDIRMSQLHANFPFYVNAGPDNSMVGCFGENLCGWSEPISTIYSGSRLESGGITSENTLTEGAPFGEWFNDEAYFNTSWVDIEVELDVNDQMTFYEKDGGQVKAIITPKIYTSGAELAAEIQDKMQALDTEGATYSVIFGSGDKITIQSDATPFNMLVKTDPSLSPIWGSIGFDDSYDRHGTAQYEGDYPLVVGASAGAEIKATRSLIDRVNNVIKIDPAYVLGGTHSKTVSDVVPFKTPASIKGLTCSFGFEGEHSFVDSDNSNTDRTMLVRASNKLFDKFDAAGTTQLDWTHISLEMIDPSIAEKYFFWQYGLVMRTNAIV